MTGRLPIRATPRIAVRLAPPHFRRTAPSLRSACAIEPVRYDENTFPNGNTGRTGTHGGTSGRLVGAASQDRGDRLAAAGGRGRADRPAARHRQPEQLRPRAGGPGRAGPG